MTELMLFAMIQWGLFTALIARSKRRNVAAWFAIGAVLPLIGLAIVLVADPLPKQRDRLARAARFAKRARVTARHDTPITLPRPSLAS